MTATSGKFLAPLAFQMGVYEPIILLPSAHQDNVQCNILWLVFSVVLDEVNSEWSARFVWSSFVYSPTSTFISDLEEVKKEWESDLYGIPLEKLERKFTSISTTSTPSTPRTTAAQKLRDWYQIYQYHAECTTCNSHSKRFFRRIWPPVLLYGRVKRFPMFWSSNMRRPCANPSHILFV